MYIDSVLHNNLQHMFQNKEIRCSLKMQYEFLTPAQTRSFGRGTHWCKVILGLQPICARFEIMHETTKSNLKLYTQIFIDVNQVVICGSYKSYISFFLDRTYIYDRYHDIYSESLGDKPCILLVKEQMVHVLSKSFRSTVGWKLELWGGYKGTKISVHFLLS